MTARLTRTASGARHLRWALEIQASLQAHEEINYLLEQPQRDILTTEIGTLGGLITPLQASVTAYRGFLETAHVGIRAKQRVADFLCDEAQEEANGQLRPRRADINSVFPGGFASIFSGKPISRILRAGREATVKFAREAAARIRALPPAIPRTAPLADALEKAADTLDGLNKERESTVDAARLPLRTAVESAIFQLREGLSQMDGRLRGHFSQRFIESLYPELSARGTRVVDDEDEEDDDSSPV